MNIYKVDLLSTRKDNENVCTQALCAFFLTDFLSRKKKDIIKRFIINIRNDCITFTYMLAYISSSSFSISDYVFWKLTRHDMRATYTSILNTELPDPVPI